MSNWGLSAGEKYTPSHLPPITLPHCLIWWCLGLLWVLNGFEELVKALNFPLEFCPCTDPKDSTATSIAPSEGSFGLFRAVASDGTYHVYTVQHHSHQPHVVVSTWNVVSAAKTLTFKSYLLLINS